jgi:hypothetical protein
MDNAGGYPPRSPSFASVTRARHPVNEQARDFTPSGTAAKPVSEYSIHIRRSGANDFIHEVLMRSADRRQRQRFDG